MTSHFSLNIKTLSAQTNAVVLSIAIAKFTKTQILEVQHTTLELEGQSGRHIDTARFHWWLKQFKERREVTAFPEMHWGVRSALRELNAFIVRYGSTPPDPHTATNIIWMRGVQFDWAILENLSHQFEVGLSFRHNAIRDQRTFCDDHVVHDPIKHRDAKLDAIYHANQIQETLKIIGQPLK